MGWISLPQRPLASAGGVVQPRQFRQASLELGVRRRYLRRRRCGRAGPRDSRLKRHAQYSLHYSVVHISFAIPARSRLPSMLTHYSLAPNH